jgi:hypothetical protein
MPEWLIVAEIKALSSYSKLVLMAIQNFEMKMNYFLRAKDEPDTTVSCSSCGAPIRDSAARTTGGICLICHARILNEQFQKVRDGKSGKPNRQVPPRS